MSLNIVAAWLIAIVGVSDRRVSEFSSKKALTNRSTKMTVFGCADAHGLIVYNGIGWDDEGLTPSDWLMRLAEKKLFDSELQHVLEGVRIDLEGRLRKLRANLAPFYRPGTQSLNVSWRPNLRGVRIAACDATLDMLVARRLWLQ